MLNVQLYGEIRALDSACKHRGFVMISYFDIRAAQKAIEALQDRPLRFRKLDIHYSIPKVSLPIAIFPNSQLFVALPLESKYCYHVMVHIVYVYI